MSSSVTKAVIPAAGFGTRFLPQTKAMPKEMLPIVDKPVIQFVVEELVGAGVTDIFIVTGYYKRSIEDHFDAPLAELSGILENGGEKKRRIREEVMRIANMANFVYIRQKGPYGNGTPLLNVRHLIGNEPFFYLWGDDFIAAEPVSRARQLIEVYREYGCPVLGCIRAGRDDDYNKYGYADGKEIEPGLVDVTSVIEKPGREKAPSDLATVSGFLLTPDIFRYLDRVVADLKPGQELYYNDMLKLMLKDKKRILAKEITGGRYYDTGSKLEYLKTVVEFGLKHPEIGKEFTKWLEEVRI
jgi:UTP--glucose-1-phosphate uridylyltransferase